MSGQQDDPAHGRDRDGGQSSGDAALPHTRDTMDEQASSASIRRTRFSLVWLIPIVVVVVAAWLGWTTLSSRGPEITITFDTADGITAGQTQVKHKAVALGTVENVGLSKDLKTVEIRVRMNAQSKPFLTSNAQFWVVRPRLSGATVSGLDTLVSGAYIAVDPGAPGGAQQSEFVGK